MQPAGFLAEAVYTPGVVTEIAFVEALLDQDTFVYPAGTDRSIGPLHKLLKLAGS
jgi:hypothetical protein